MKLGKTAAVLLALGMTLGMQGPGRCQSSDDFNGPELSPAWAFITPSTPGSYLDLTSRPGFLHMVSSDLDAPRLWQAVSGAWALEVRLEFDPSDDFEDAGILIDGERVAEFAFDARFGGRVVSCLGGFSGYTGRTVVFRILQTSDQQIGFWLGEDGLWHEDLSGVRYQVASTVGLFLARHDQDGHTPRPASADFDYFDCSPWTPTPVKSSSWARLKGLYR